MCAVVSHRGESVVGVGLTVAVVANLDLGHGHEVVGQLFGEGASDLLSRTHRQLDGDGDTVGVGLGHHFGAQSGEEHHQ